MFLFYGNVGVSFMGFVLDGKVNRWLLKVWSVPSCKMCVGASVVNVIVVSGRMTLKAVESQSNSSICVCGIINTSLLGVVGRESLKRFVS